jgi:uncharacterized membrane protein
VESYARRHRGDEQVTNRWIQGEKRWPVLVTLAVALAVPLLLPPRFTLGAPWVIPTIEALLATVVVVAQRGSTPRQASLVRAASVALITVLVAGAAGVTVRMIADLIEGGPETNSAGALLRDGFLVWLYTIIAFGFLYWEVDSGGPERRLAARPQFPDLAFPEHLNPGVAPPSWHPEFFDYLYLGFTNATAFSPTDVMPIARWGKLAMSVQSVVSLMILGLVIARAVNILN